MSVRIGHASTAKTNRASQVTIRNWYSNNWNYVLRPKDVAVAENLARVCEEGCNNDNIEYSQTYRNTLRNVLKLVGMDMKRVNCDTYCDCSSFMTVCAECCGINVPYNGDNAPTTNTMKTAFVNTGYFEILTDSKYLTSDKYVKRGDILVKTGSHTVMVLDNGEGAIENVNQMIDISKYNQIKDYKRFAQQFKYVMIRAGYRAYGSGVITEDTLFKTHITNCISNNMNVGIYFFSQAINVQEAIQEAQWVCAKIKPYKTTLPIFIDSEMSNTNHNGRADALNKTLRTQITVAFCEEIKRQGYVAGVYASDSWFKTQLDFEQLKDYIIWVARYSASKPTISKYNIWQYSSSYIGDFAAGRLDINYIYDLKTNVNTDKKEEITKNNIDNIVTATKLNVRTLPSTSGKIVRVLDNKDKVQIYGYKNGWYLIGKDEYVSANYIENKTIGTVTASMLNVRSGAGTNYAIISQIKNGTKVKLLNETNGWYMILINNLVGYISCKYVSII